MIYVLGSLNMDLVTNIPRLPRKGETLAGENFFTNCGGKGANQAAAVAKLGGQVKMIGKVGQDAYGAEMKKSLADYGVDVSKIKTQGESSGIAMILVEKGDNRIILHSGANAFLDEKDVDEGLSEAKEGDILLTQLECPLKTVRYALEKAKSYKMTTILNPAPAVKEAAELIKFCDIVAPNETETEILTGVTLSGEVELALAVKKFYEYGAKSVVVTLGKDGSAVSRGNEITLIEPEKVKVVDTTCAGDTFIGAMAVKLFELGLEGACRYGSKAASITITQKGASVSIPTAQQVRKIYGI